MVSRPTLRGLVLEEVLARLLKSSGNRLLTRVSDDRHALKAAPHGLLIRGRGASHQADALRKLVLPTPFSMPIRLLAEAKFQDRPPGLDAVRNALGVVNDVNERCSHDSASTRELPPQPRCNAQRFWRARPGPGRRRPSRRPASARC